MPDGAWYVVQTEPQRERMVEAGLLQDGYEPYLPRIQRDRLSRIVPLFPSYLFVAVSPHWWPIQNMRGVRKLLKNGGDRPAELPDAVIAEIRSRERNGLVRLPRPPQYRRGQSVNIIRGPFADRTAIYVGMSSKERERVLLELLGQHVEITLPARVLAAP